MLSPSLGTLSSTACLKNSQIDLLYQLRIAEKLQGLTYPKIVSSHDYKDDIFLSILNWLASCFVHNATSDSVAVAVAAKKSFITLYISNSPHIDLDTTKHSANVFLTTLRQLLSVDEGAISPDVSTRVFLRIIISISYLRIQRKIHLVGKTDKEPGQTAYRFGSLVSLWLLHHPEGERSPGILNMAINYGGGADRANHYLLQSLLTIVQQTHVNAEIMETEERYTYLSSLITACHLLLNSTFFADLDANDSFRKSLKPADRIFIYKLRRRISRVSTYKTGAIEFAYLGLPFIRRVLGHDGIQTFLAGSGGIEIQYVTQHLQRNQATPITKIVVWSKSPKDHLPCVLGECKHNEDLAPFYHSGNESMSSVTSSSTSSSSSHANHNMHNDLAHLSSQLRDELLNSDLLAHAWVKDAPIQVHMHCEVQLVQYLEECNLDVSFQAIGTSKPICRTCSCYLSTLRKTEIDIDEMGDSVDVETWWHSKGSGKTYSDWMIPFSATAETIDILLYDTHREMCRIVEDVAFGCYP